MDNVSRETALDVAAAPVPEPGCYVVGGELRVVDGAYSSRTGLQLVGFLRANGTAEAHAVEMWPAGAAERLSGRLAELTLWAALRWRNAKHAATVTGCERDAGEASGYFWTYRHLAALLDEERREPRPQLSALAAELRHVEGQLRTATAYRRAQLLDLRRSLLDRLADAAGQP